jgi:hypothetical protein
MNKLAETEETYIAKYLNNGAGSKNNPDPKTGDDEDDDFDMPLDDEMDNFQDFDDEEDDF